MSQLFRAEVLDRDADHLGEPREWVPRSLGKWLWLVGLSALFLVVLILNQSYADKVNVSGVTQGVQQSALVRSRAAGVVDSIPARLGEAVRAGQTLVVVDQSTHLADGRQKHRILKEQVAEQLVAKQEEILLYRKVRDAERHRQTTKLRDTRETAELMAERLELQRIATETVGREFLRHRRLATVRLISASDLQNIHTRWLNQRQNFLEQKLKLHRLEQEIRELRLALDGLQRATELQVNRLTADERSLRHRHETLSEGQMVGLVSPISGVVADIVVRPGSSVTAGSTVAGVRPFNEEVRAELQLPAQAAAKVELGQLVRLQMPAYPYQKHGLAQARIVEIARLNTGVGQSFRALAEFQKLPDGVARVPLGMQLQGEVILNETEIWRRLSQPIVTAFDRT